MAQQYPIEALCRNPGVSRSGYYDHRKKPLRKRRVEDEQLRPKIAQIFEDSRRTYGSPRIHAELAKQGVRCSKNRVARIMREQNLRPVQKKKYRPRGSEKPPGFRPAPNWLDQLPKPDAPNQIWTSDITYIWTHEGWLYLACHMDYFSRRIVGWAVSDSLETDLVFRSLQMAYARRCPGLGLIHHSDRGCQYTSRDFTEHLQEIRVSASMSGKGNCYDNAAHESFWATLKTECFAKQISRTRKQAELMIFSYIEGFYNTRRRHSALGYRCPDEYELDYHATAFCGTAVAA